MGGDQGNLGGINAQPKPSRSNVDIFYDTPRCQAVVSDIAPTSIRNHTVGPRRGLWFLSGARRGSIPRPNRRKHVKLPSRIGELKRSWEVRRSVQQIGIHILISRVGNGLGKTVEKTISPLFSWPVVPWGQPKSCNALPGARFSLPFAAPLCTSLN
jgi:hypothetical protein